MLNTARTWLYQNYAKPTNHILDTHGGSFSSAIAAHYFGCKFTGVEKDPEYFEAAIKRFREHVFQEKEVNGVVYKQGNFF